MALRRPLRRARSLLLPLVDDLRRLEEPLPRPAVKRLALRVKTACRRVDAYGQLVADGVGAGRIEAALGGALHPAAFDFCRPRLMPAR